MWNRQRSHNRWGRFHRQSCVQGAETARPEPVAFDNLSRGHRETVKWGELVVGDIRDTSLVRETLRAHGIDAVMHFAALVNVGELVTSPAEYYDVNVSGTLSVLNAMREEGMGTIILSSSCATYGIPDRVPVEETAPQRPINPYGRSKVAAEMALRDFASAYRMQVAALRYFNAAGADGDGELHQKSGPVSHLIPLAIKASRGLTERLAIFGTDYPTTDGRAYGIMFMSATSLKVIPDPRGAAGRCESPVPEPGNGSRL